MRTLFTFAVLLALPFSASAQQAKPPPADQPAGHSTLENLLAAYEGESNAHARYVEFAKKADQEGFGQVASLFRAAARAEQIHAGTHAEAIKKLRGTPKANIEKPEVKTTRENLEAALKGESYERDTMYPEFLARAKADKNREAIETFNYALTAEREHARLYKEALDNLDAWKSGKREFFVCSVCGLTTTKLDFSKCASCFSPKEKYEKVS
ncbi:MAG: rubrerythrin family protein [Phycisphaerae bacterium]